MSLILLLLVIAIAWFAGVQSYLALETIESWVLPIILLIVSFALGITLIGYVATHSGYGLW